MDKETGGENLNFGGHVPCARIFSIIFMEVGIYR